MSTPPCSRAPTRLVHFLVRTRIDAQNLGCLGIGDDDVVFISGEGNSLGEWAFDQAVPLHKCKTEGGISLWGADVILPCGDISYRYLICSKLPSCRFSRKNTILKKWEAVSHRTCKLVAGDETFIQDDGQFGWIDGCGASVADKGFLTGQAELQVRFSDDTSCPISLSLLREGALQQIDPQQCYIRVTPAWMPMDEPPISSECPVVTVKHLSVPSWQFEEKAQSEEGERYSSGDVLVFSVQTFDLAYLALKIDVLVRQEGLSHPELVASTCLLPSNHVCSSSVGHVFLPLLNNAHLPIGHLEANFVVIHSLRQAPHDLSKSFTRHWDETEGTLHVAHRGMGNSMTLSTIVSSITENSISSFRNAARHGADLIEFDVQLTQDLEVIVYHDFTFQAQAIRDQDCSQYVPLELVIRDCTMDLLRSISVDTGSNRLKFLRQEEKGPPQTHRHFDNTSSVSSFSCDTCASTLSVDSGVGSDGDGILKRKLSTSSLPSLDLAVSEESTKGSSPLFPRLSEVFDQVPLDVGFDVELKYPVAPSDPEEVTKSYFDVNVFVDRVLEVVFAHAGQRRIILSSFHADICTCLRLKQCKYPVFFLTNGDSVEYEPLYDRRGRSLFSGVMFAKSEQLSGIAPDSASLVQRPSDLMKVLDTGLLVMSWGNANNSWKNLHCQEKHGIHAVCHDMISHGSRRRNQYVVNVAEAPSVS